MSRPTAIRRRTLVAAVLSLALSAPAFAAGPTLLNVSYDVSREFYKDDNAAFAAHWKKTRGQDVTVNPTTFAQRGLGDALVTFESEVPLIEREFGGGFEVVNTFTVDSVLGGWAKAQKDHFNDGASYDQVIAAAKR